MPFKDTIQRTNSYQILKQLYQTGHGLKYLFEKYYQENNPEFCYSFISLLSHVKSEISFDLLLQILKSTQQPKIKEFVIKNFRSFPLEKIQPELLALLTTADNHLLRQLFRVIAYYRKDAVPILSRLLQHEQTAIRRYAALYSGKLETRTIVPPLVQALQDEDSRVQLAVIKALGHLRAESALEALIQLLNHEDPILRRQAARSLKKTNFSASLKYLCPLLKSPQSDARRQATWALLQLNPPNLLNTFLPLLKDGDPLVRRYAIEGIRKLPLEQSFIPLLHALAESNLTVQASIRRILLPLGNDVLKEKFNLLFQRNNPKLRWLVVMAMERLPLSYPELMHRATTDQNERVRQQAKRTLAIKVKTGSKSLVSDKT